MGVSINAVGSANQECVGSGLVWLVAVKLGEDWAGSRYTLA